MMENARNEADSDQIREEEIDDDGETGSAQVSEGGPQKPATGLASNSRPEDEQAQVQQYWDYMLHKYSRQNFKAVY